MNTTFKNISILIGIIIAIIIGFKLLAFFFTHIVSLFIIGALVGGGYWIYNKYVK